MTQQAIVLNIDSTEGSAVVEVTRQSSCGGDCGSCKGCTHPEQTIRVKAGNAIGAAPGDRVLIETETKKVFVSAYMAYILPLLLMFAFYFLPFGSSEGIKILLSFCGLALGVAICRLYSKRLSEKSSVRAEITKIFAA